MNLSPKATRFVNAALEHYDRFLDQRLSQERLPDDEASDLTNDREYLEAIRQEFEAYHKELLQHSEALKNEA